MDDCFSIQLRSLVTHERVTERQMIILEEHMKKIIGLVAVLFLVGCSKKEETTDQSSVKPPTSTLISQESSHASTSSSSSTTIESTSISSEPVYETSTVQSTEEPLPVISEADLFGKVFSGNAMFSEGQSAAYTISFNAVKNADLVGDVLFTSFPGSQAGTMEYFDRMLITVTGPNSYRVTAEQPHTESSGQPTITLDIVKSGENQIEFSLADKYFILSYDEQVTSQLAGD